MHCDFYLLVVNGMKVSKPFFFVFGGLLDWPITTKVQKFKNQKSKLCTLPR
jgi:hypothetical protein